MEMWVRAEMARRDDVCTRVILQCVLEPCDALVGQGNYGMRARAMLGVEHTLWRGDDLSLVLPRVLLELGLGWASLPLIWPQCGTMEP